MYLGPVRDPGALVPDILGDLDFELDNMDTLDHIGQEDPLVGPGLDDPLAQLATMQHSLSLFALDSLSQELGGEMRAEAGKVGGKRSFLDEPETSPRLLDPKGKIRRDCMWSTGQNLCKLLRPDTKPAASTTIAEESSGGPRPARTKGFSWMEEEMSLTPPTSYINQYLNPFQSPLHSDEESSCSSSGDEIDAVSDWSSMIMGPPERRLAGLDMESRLIAGGSSSLENNNKDHSYTALRDSVTLTPPDSSEDEESCPTPDSTLPRSRVLETIDNDRLNQAVQSILVSTNARPSTHHNNFAKASKAKFTFKVNIKKLQDKNKWKKNRFPAMVTGGSSSTSCLLPGSGSLHLAAAAADRPKDARDLHNHMERQRRNELKTAFDLVRTCVPTISASDRASKQMILDKAIDFCRGLRVKEARACRERRALLERNARLLKQLALLRKQQSIKQSIH